MEPLVQLPPLMARNERAGNCWSQPPRSTTAKNQSGRSRGLGTEDLDDIGDIVNALSCGERRILSGDRQSNKHTTNHGKYSSDCCLKNGLVQCHCLWPENNISDWQRRNKCLPNPCTREPQQYDKKWPDNHMPNVSYRNNKMLEEFILDDNELGLLNYYDIPINVPRRHLRSTGKVKTVSIIDTLSELASGATDREDEGGFSSAVSESAVLNRYLHKPKARHARQSVPRRNCGLPSNNFIPTSKTAPIDASSAVKRSAFTSPIRTESDSFTSVYSPLEDNTLPCSSLKRTLKYLRKAVASNVLEEENRNRRHIREKQNDDDSFRLCFSDSEVKDPPVHWAPLRHNRLEFTPKVKSKSLLTVADSYTKPTSKPAIFKNRSKTSVPDWIQAVFTASKKGDVDQLKLYLTEIDPALVRNLSDDHGNNLWHICAVHNNFECLNWLCSYNPHHAEALKDENKNGFSPASLAVKHGSLLAVQWLIHNTVCKNQLLPQSSSRSLLHIAAKYGQYATVEWILNYMVSQDLDASLTDSEGNTAVHFAAKYGHINCVKALVFQIGNIKSKNEHGLKPLDLALKHGKNDCADFLIAVESCYNLASLNLRQHLDIQHLQKENAEMKNYFKELLTLTKRLQHRQKELVQSYSRLSLTQQYSAGSSDWVNDKNIKYLDDYSQLLDTVMTDEEHRLLMVENKWKKSRKQTKLQDSRKKPLDILKSQFKHVLEKVNSLSPPIPSTPESSDSSSQSENEDDSPPEKNFPDLSPPDVVNSLFPQTSVPFLDTRQKFSKESASLDTLCDMDQEDTINSSLLNSPVSKKAVPPCPPSNRDVNLRMFFKQNPNLRQSVKTCSVLEVLEPSSSDSEEFLGYKKKLSKHSNSEKEAEQSSSSSALEILPSSGRPSSLDSKASGSHSSSSGGRQNIFTQNASSADNAQAETSNANHEKDKSSENTGNHTSDSSNKYSCDQIVIECALSSEPDLIKGTQKKKMLSPFSTIEKKTKCSKDSSDTILVDNLNFSTDSESLEADRSFSSAAEASGVLRQSNIEVTNGGQTLKKKGFLFKFALRGKWQSKGTTRSLKNEISPEEFRETYSRTSLSDNVPSPSHLSPIPNCPATKSLPKNNDLESLPIELEKLLEKETPVICERPPPECNLFPPISNSLQNHSTISSRKTLLPPRRDPPPAPPLNIDEDEHLQDHSDDDVSISIQKSSTSSCIEGSSHNSYLNSRSPDLWHSSVPKSHFRPASSASCVDSPSRGEENFPLNKSSSASNEMLSVSVLGSSTAGRQSPAPSEVSKTESALSPPSDVSKTESTRYLSQLGKIEETGHLTAMKVTNLQSSEEHNIKEDSLNIENKTPKNKKCKKINSNKPWYEFSDEEDVIVPQRYQSVSGSMRSSSGDEAAATS
ncbi:hypothetical protein JTE90_012609 [Oedothorax gibbosus]|uniref:Synphilin-1 n=1 Tax=Oedothorax gibbosus TaxID=931172 RepID=A0AAV6TU86_9ARAC|nr:hypothetical protein JTE90_012609 [Oedothorax gibbosus]